MRYAATVPSTFTMKLSKLLCLECSAYAVFFYSSFTVFYNSPFPKKQPVRHAHQSPLHVAFQFGDKLYTICKQPLEEVSVDIPFVRNQFAIDEFDKSLLLQRFSVIHITRSYHEVPLTWLDCGDNTASC